MAVHKAVVCARSSVSMSNEMRLSFDGIRAACNAGQSRIAVVSGTAEAYSV